LNNIGCLVRKSWEVEWVVGLACIIFVTNDIESCHACMDIEPRQT